MRQGRLGVRSATFSAATSVLLLTGCTLGSGPAALHAPTVPSPTQSARASATGANGTVPSGVRVDCTEVLPATSAESLLGTGAVPVDPDLNDLSGRPTHFALSAAGGASCAWGAEGSAGGSLEIAVLPGAGAAWDALATWYPDSATQRRTYGTDQSRGAGCVTQAVATDCVINLLVAQHWVEIHATAEGAGGASLPGRFTAMIGSVAARLDRQLAGTAHASGIQPDDPSTLCLSPKTAAAVAAAFGSRVARYQPPKGSFGIEDALILVHGAALCPFSPSTDGSGGILVTVRVIPNASAQFAVYRALLTAPRDALFIHLPGASRPAIGRVIDTNGLPQYVLDVVRGDDWLQVTCDDIDSAPVHAAALARWLLAH